MTASVTPIGHGRRPLLEALPGGAPALTRAWHREQVDGALDLVTAAHVRDTLVQLDAARVLVARLERLIRLELDLVNKCPDPDCEGPAGA